MMISDFLKTINKKAINEVNGEKGAHITFK